MRGFLLGAIILIGLDVALSSPASRLAGVLTPFTTALVNWLDPTVPLISDHSGALSASPPGTSTGRKARPGKPPPGPKPPGEVRSVGGKCPPGWIPDDQHPGYCLQALA